MLTAISAKYEGEPCAAWLGTDGAGHFVKTIHNGIEYADMQMIAEIYGILRDGLGMGPKEIAPVFAGWNKGRLNSYLIEITATVLAADDPKTGKPVVEIILDRAGQKGTGKWSAIEAQQLGIPATAIEAAVAARVLSSLKDERVAAEKAYGKGGVTPFAGNKDDVLADLELALFAGKIAAYAQGFAVMSAASREFGWNLPLPTIAKIWRAGCIIRSQFLGTHRRGLRRPGEVANLLMTPAFIAMMKEAHPALRRIVARAGRSRPADAGAGLRACLFRQLPAGRAAPPTSSRRSAISSAPMASSASTRPAPFTAPGAAAPRLSRHLSRSEIQKDEIMAWHPADNRYDSMIYNRCGRSGLKLPAISLGLWHNFGDDTPHDSSARSARRLSISASRISTSPTITARRPAPPRRRSARFCAPTSPASRRAGRLHQGRLRDVARPLRRMGQPQILLASLDQSLKRLGLDYVDIFYSHRYDPETPLEETMGALDTAVRSGKALYVGISSYNSQRTREAAAILRALGTPFRHPPAELFDDQPLGRGRRAARHAGGAGRRLDRLLAAGARHADRQISLRHSGNQPRRAGQVAARPSSTSRRSPISGR